MADDKIKHTHSPNDIIIKDQDGSYKILRDGKFVPLDEAEAKMHALDAGPKRAPDAPKSPQPPTFPTKIPVQTAKPAAPVPMKAPQSMPMKTAAPVTASKPSSMPPAMNAREEDATTKQAEAILQKTNLTFASGEIRSRVKNVLVSHLKGIRKPFETKLYLIKGVRDGGAGLTEQEAEIVLMAASGFKARSSAAPQKLEPPSTDKPMTPVGKEVSVPRTPPVTSNIPAMPEMTMEAAKPVGPAFAPRPTLADVQKPMRTLGGPVDQLSYDLMTWRRLGQDPRDRIKKVETQLDVLEQDGYPERLKGLLSWHNSEVVRKYIEAGKKSVESSTSLPQMLGSGSENELSYAEWQAIADLNARIRP